MDLGAVLVTYDRPEQLRESILAVGAQTVPLARLVVVDNGMGADDVVDAVRHAVPCPIEVLASRTNDGPAGGFNRGVSALAPTLGPEGWVLLLDDDDPLPSPEVLAHLLATRDRLCGSGIALGGIGMKGARFDRRRIRTVPVRLGRSGVVEVDHLHGGYGPLYRVQALSDAGNFRTELFWGFEELDIGLRLVDAGWRLFMDLDTLNRFGDNPKLAASSRPQFRVEGWDPRRYYKLRNLTVIASERASRRHVAVALALRAVAKPLANLLIRPRRAVAALRGNLVAVRDARAGRLGRTYPW